MTPEQQEQQRQIDILDATCVDAYIKELETTSPHLPLIAPSSQSPLFSLVSKREVRPDYT
jgi:hypothetical protein